MVNIFYPHKLKVEKQNTDWGDSADFEDYGECEDQPNDAGRRTTNKDGEMIDFKSIVFVPKTLAPLPIGAKIQVFEQDGTLRLEGNVSRFSHDHFRNRIWVS